MDQQKRRHALVHFVVWCAFIIIRHLNKFASSGVAQLQKKLSSTKFLFQKIDGVYNCIILITPQAQCIGFSLIDSKNKVNLP